MQNNASKQIPESSEPKPRQNSKLLDVVRTMPPLSHWPDRWSPYDPAASEVCRWLVSQPEISQWIFEIVKGRKLIAYDPYTAKWSGRKQ